MFTISRLMIVFTTAGGLMLAACSKDESKQAPPTEEAPKNGADSRFAAGMMKSYEVCRSLLANDKSEGIAECATGIVEASKAALAGAPEAAQGHIGSLVKAAEALAKAPAEDIAAQRLSFGDVSEATVAMLTAAPDAAKGYHVFECPMAKGYKRWAQPGPALENPYMGASMLSCGSAVPANGDTGL